VVPVLISSSRLAVMSYFSVIIYDRYCAQSQYPVGLDDPPDDDLKD